MESSRIWLLADEHHQAISSVKDILTERGATVELLHLSDAMEKVLRQRGGRLLENFKSMLARVRGADLEQEDQEEAEEALGDVLERGRPDLIVASSARYLGSLDLLARAAGGQALPVALLPDYNLGNAWLKGAAQAYIIPHEGLKAPLLEAGIEDKRLFVAGPAVPQSFSARPDAAALRKDFALEDAPGAVVLLLCHHMDAAELDRLVFQLSLVESPLTPIFYVGEDEQAAEALRRAARTHGILANLLRQVPNPQDFFAVAHLILARPEDERITGALALDRPLLLVGDAGPVTTQADFLVARGAALHCKDLLRLGAEVELALRPGRLEDMERASAEVGRTTGSLEVADALALILRDRAELQRAPATVPGDNGDQPSFQGPFERIGVPRHERNAPAPSPGPFEPVGRPTPGPAAQSRPAPAPAPAQPPAPRPTHSPLSADEAKDELAALIMTERELERDLAQVRREQEQWHNRLELAREWNEGELAREAEERLRRVLDDAERMQVELDKVRVQKEKLKERVRGGRPAPASPAPSGSGADTGLPSARGAEGGPIESRFRDMEVESDLNALRQRLRDELDE